MIDRERLAWLDQRWPDDPELQFMIGTYQMDRGDHVTVGSAFRKAALRSPPLQVDALFPSPCVSYGRTNAWFLARRPQWEPT